MKYSTPRPYFPGVKTQAKKLRRALTPTEKILWSALRNHHLRGLKSRRQQPLGPFIADFYCPVARLVIEIDGEVHVGHEMDDINRSQQLNDHGYRVLHFKNEEVQNHLDRVLEMIAKACSAQPE